ncbi:MAG: non-canonical purine NTP pyrophosphatase, RdgB/HAM1 family [Gammaproteobacteria bacterium RIFCSPHIGHO2_12_FULL_37_14]|nr:MAG: non-canonical purine NTP pyrophosphatase, RdgB/HAM1 family [Gammaproteobacteria bacterium RIFCSPHIGHO2_12_FULL_37_14]
MSIDFVFASNNRGKIRELQAAIEELNFSIIPQAELGVQEIPEDKLTFVENALIKARHACWHTGFPAIADDSGLVVAVLNGKPGIHSARYAGPEANAKENINKLLVELATVPEANRQAYFFCTLVWMAHAEDPAPLICQGTWHGYILNEPLGNDGFGYDPVFYVPSEGKSAAELTLEQKNLLSHRGKAVRQLLEHLMHR